MSYSFDGSGDYGNATFTESLAYPFTLGCWVKQPTFVGTGNLVTAASSASNRALIQASYVASNSWYGLLYDGTNDCIRERAQDITSGTSGPLGTGWWPMLLVCTNSTTREIYVNGTAGTELNAGTVTLASLTQFFVGRSWDYDEYFTGKLARVCAWKIALDASQRSAFAAGTAPTSIINSAGDLRKWFEFSANNVTQTNGGSDSGDMTMGGATYDSDHPTFGAPFVLPIYDRLFRQNTLLRM